jgi:hypothetical protein
MAHARAGRVRRSPRAAAYNQIHRLSGALMPADTDIALIERLSKLETAGMSDVLDEMG